MKRLAIFLVILALIAFSFIIYFLVEPEITGKVLDNYSQTKAICNETNYCQDYQISCDEERAIMMTPITGAVIQFPKNWTDPRNDSEKELC